MKTPVRIASLGILAVTILAIAMLHGVLASAAEAGSPIGLWKTVDDKTGNARAIVRIYEQDGKLFGRIEKQLHPGRRESRVRRMHG